MCQNQSKALHDFDKLYVESEDDQMINDITSQIDCLESGPLKYQLTEFVLRYKDVANRADESRLERNEVLESLMEWFTGQQFSDEFMEIGAEDTLDEQSLQLRDQLLNTKVGFDKLKQLNKELVDMAKDGKDIGHLERERHSVRQHAILNFKAFKNVSLEAKQAREMGEQKFIEDVSMGATWKNAAGEIVGLLSRVREDGIEYIGELEKQVRRLTSDVEDNAFLFNKFKSKVKEYQLLEEKWKDDNIALVDDKAKTRKKLGIYKRELRKALKSLSKYERVKPPKFLDEDDITEAKEAAPLKEAKAEEAKAAEEAAKVPTSGFGDPTILKAQLKDCRNQLEKANMEKEELNSEIEKLKEALEDMEDDVLRLEKDKQELIHQMKQNSLRPDKRRLSDARPIKQPSMLQQRSSRAMNGSLTIVQIKATDSLERTQSKRCCKCGLKPASPQTSETSQALPTSDTEIQQTMSVHVKTTDGREEEIEALSKRCFDLESRVKELEDLLKTQEERGAGGEVVQQVLEEEELLLPEETPAAPTSAQPETTAEPQEKHKRTEVKKEEPAFDLRRKQEKPQIRSPSPEDTREPFALFTSVNLRHLPDALIIADKGVQTDPKLDPLGPWSTASTGQEGPSWQPPLPPTTWMDFDPTVRSSVIELQELSEQDVKQEPLREAMLSGIDPSNVKEEAMQCANMVQRELGRMTLGIRSFLEYTNTLVDRETRIMAAANKELKRHLSDNELDQLRQTMQPTSTTMAGSKSRVDMQLQGTPSQAEAIVNRMVKDRPAGPAYTERHPGREQMMPIEEKVKHQVNRIGQRSVDTLKRAYDLVFGVLQDQHREYEQIYTTIHKRGDPKHGMEVEDLEEMPELLAPKRSKSHSDVKQNEALQDKVPLAVARSKSNTEIGLKKRGIKFDLDDEDRFSPSHIELGGTFSRAVASGKSKIDVAKATLSKKGQIILTTTPIQQQSFGSLFTPQDPVHRKVKPVPVNHTKLKMKQEELMFRAGNEFKPKGFKQRTLRQSSGRQSGKYEERTLSARKSGRQTSGRHTPQKSNVVMGRPVLTDFELPADFFSEYTVGELEKTAMQYAEQQKQHLHDEMLQKVHFPEVSKEMSHKLGGHVQKNVQEEKLPQITF